MTATLLGGINVATTSRAIAVLDDHLFAVNASSGDVFRYGLPGLANTEGTSPWASTDSGYAIRGLTADEAGGRLFSIEIRTSPTSTRLYELDPAGSFPTTKTLRASTSSMLLTNCVYNPVTDSIWCVGDDLWEVDASGGSFTAVDTTFTGVTQGQLSVDPSGNVWGLFISGTLASHTLLIYKWSPAGSRTTVLSEAATGAEPGPGFAWTDGTFLFSRDTGSGDVWSSITAGGSISTTDLLDGPNGPYPDLLYRMTESAGTGYVVQDAGESGLTNDIFTFTGGGAAWRVGRIGWGTRGAWS